MVNPFKYRPKHGGEDPDVEDMEWEDNALSNFMAWMSQQWPFEPMCNTEQSTTSRIANYLYTDCPCCLFWRGVSVGIFSAVLILFLILFIYLLTTL